MNIIVVGCGRVGSQLASELSHMGHDVAVVDESPDNFQLLPAGFAGFTLAGVPIDRDVLLSAGIESCDALAAMTASDSTNIMLCQMARELFHVENVLARIYDPERKEVFSHFGLETVCPTQMTVSAAISCLTLRGTTRQLTFGSATVSFSQVPVPRSLAGRMATDIPETRQEVLLGVLHPDGELVLGSGCRQPLLEDDILIFASRAD